MPTTTVVRGIDSVPPRLHLKATWIAYDMHTRIIVHGTNGHVGVLLILVH